MRFKPLCVGVTKCCMVFLKATELYLVLFGWGSSYNYFVPGRHFLTYTECVRNLIIILEIPHSIGGFGVTIIIAVLPKDLKLLNSKVWLLRTPV